MTDNSKGAFAMLAAMALFTFNDACMKSLSDELPLFEAIFLRGLLTSAFLLGLAYFLKGLKFDLSRHDWGLIGLRTIAEVAATYCFITALFNAPIANITAILQALPLTVTLTGAVFLGEAIGWRRLSAIGVGFIGVLFIVQPGAAGFNYFSLYALATVASVTVRDLAARRLSKDVPTLTIAFCGAAAVMIFAGIGSLSEEWVMPSPFAFMQLGGAGLFIIGAYISSVMTMRQGDIGLIAPLRYTGLIWAIILGVFLFDETLDTLTIIGIAIVVATGLFTLMRERALGRKPAAPAVRVR